MTPQEIIDILPRVSSIAQAAGNFLKSHLQEGQLILSDLPRDVKLGADYLLHDFIQKELEREWEIPVFSEESPGNAKIFQDKKYRWIVDPLDGSLNFSRGIPFSCISIGLHCGEKPILGVIFDPWHEDLFTGVPGTGAWKNEQAIRVSKVQDSKSAILCTGFPVKTDFSETSLHGILRQIQTFKKVRLLGSAALSLAYVACGRADAYYEKGIAIWDIAAGVAIVQAAGGHVFIAPATSKNRVTVRATADSRLFVET